MKFVVLVFCIFALFSLSFGQSFLRAKPETLRRLQAIFNDMQNNQASTNDTNPFRVEAEKVQAAIKGLKEMEAAAIQANLEYNNQTELEKAETAANAQLLKDNYKLLNEKYDKLIALALEHDKEIAISVRTKQEQSGDFYKVSEQEKNQIIKQGAEKTADDTKRFLEASSLKDDIKGATEKGMAVQGHISTCMSAFFKNVPPSFCWKRGGDFGRIPTECPDGFFRSLALCYRYCKPGYYHVLGVCWESCRSDYSDWGALCVRIFRGSYWKSTYVPESKTNFDIECRAGEYKGGALCYKDCNKILMTNCGIGACAASTASCVADILKMALDFLAGLGEMVLFIVSFGTSSAAKPAVSAGKKTLQEGVVQVGKAALKKAFDGFKKWLTSWTKEKIKKWLLEKVKDFVKDKIITFAIEKACGIVGDMVFDSAAKNEEPKTEISLAEQIKDKIPIYGTCSKVDSTNSSPNDEIECAKDVLETIGMVDPTGLCAMAAAFMKPVCDEF